MSAIPSEALLAGGYAIFLAGAATVLELAARHAHRRSQNFPMTGFRYHRGLDVWICPTGQHLRRTDSEHHHRVFRYRGEARICNECAVKRHCTDSDQGRVVEHYPDSWLQSALRQFHRGLSLTLLTLAFLLLTVELFRQKGVTAQISLGLLAMAIAGSCIGQLAELKKTRQPSGDPINVSRS